jgi:V8-like Glu-specific endopeptidase
MLPLILLLAVPPVFAQDKVIYGEDNRQDIVDVQSPAWVEIANSTAVMIPSADIPSGGKGGKGGRGGRKTGITISGPTLASRGICPSERFANQPTVGNCSGFLIDEKTIVTAGHCMATPEDCTDSKWVFDYKIEVLGVDSVTLQKKNIYGCKKIIKQVLDRTTQNDFAVIELDRAVTDRVPLKTRESGKVEVGTPLVVIGYPSGLPLKVAGGANVRSLSTDFFVANLDTYGGNSGSAVLNAVTMEVEGILVRGDTDYVFSPEGCRVSKVQGDNEGRGEDATFITNIKASLKR